MDSLVSELRDALKDAVKEDLRQEIRKIERRRAGSGAIRRRGTGVRSLTPVKGSEEAKRRMAYVRSFRSQKL